jgi:hypothetical protein
MRCTNGIWREVSKHDKVRQVYGRPASGLLTQQVPTHSRPSSAETFKFRQCRRMILLPLSNGRRDTSKTPEFRLSPTDKNIAVARATLSAAQKPTLRATVEGERRQLLDGSRIVERAEKVFDYIFVRAHYLVPTAVDGADNHPRFVCCPFEGAKFVPDNLTDLVGQFGKVLPSNPIPRCRQHFKPISGFFTGDHQRLIVICVSLRRRPPCVVRRLI